MKPGCMTGRAQQKTAAGKPADYADPLNSARRRRADQAGLRLIHDADQNPGQAETVKQAKRRLRILFLSPHYPPDVAATGQLVAELAQDVVTAGHESIVIASRPDRVAGSHDAAAMPENTEQRDGVQIRWLNIPTAGRRGTWSRLLPFAGYFLATAWRSLFVGKVDIVFAQSTPPLLAGLLAALHSLVPGRRFVYNLQDVYPELGQALGVLGHGPVAGLSRRVEATLRRRADRLVVLADDMREVVRNSDRQLQDVDVIPNWADAAVIGADTGAAGDFRVRNGLQDKFIVMYSGNLGRAHGVELLPQVAAQLADLPDLVLLVIGAGAALPTVQAEAQRLGLKNLAFLPFQPKEKLSESLCAADVSLILQRRSVSGLVVPSKLYGILASGRAAVAAVPPECEVARVLKSEQAGIVVEPESADGIAAAVRKLYLNRDCAAEMGTRARLAAVNRHDRQQATGRYIRLFEQLALS
ncbi:MAG: glycosyltransferase family 4 protein [Gammaproteobacteria bacterium]|nr:glycosyltransferase family 4 protein [Gammaproteobacteria bacterium]